MSSEISATLTHRFGRRPSWFWSENKSGAFVGTDRRERRYCNFNWIKGIIYVGTVKIVTVLKHHDLRSNKEVPLIIIIIIIIIGGLG